jgi:agmatine deiminase
MSMAAHRDTNLRKAVQGAREASEGGAEVVCLPELFAWRYFPSKRGAKPHPEAIPGPITEALSRCAKDNGVVLVGGTVFEDAGKKRYNTCLVFDSDGKIAAKYRKVHLPQDDHYFEQDYFSSGTRYRVARTSIGRVGALVCFDQWYPEPARISRLMGADFLFYPTAIGWVKGIEPVEGDWHLAWEAVHVGHAVSNSMVVCAVNRVGQEGDTTFWGGSFVCDQFGKILFRAGTEEGVFVVPCDLRLAKLVEDGWGFMRNRKKGTYSAIVK